jgi:hypothetical protein
MFTLSENCPFASLRAELDPRRADYSIKGILAT